VDRGEGLREDGGRNGERGQRLRGREGGMQGGYGMNSERVRSPRERALDEPENFLSQPSTR
jgi:hypothetical protein